MWHLHEPDDAEDFPRRREHEDDCTCSACDREPDECPECGDLGDWSQNPRGLCDDCKMDPDKVFAED